MKVVLATVQVPFIRGGAEILAHELLSKLQERGISADIVSIPFKWYPAETLLQCMVMAQMMDLTEVNGERIDLVIGLKFPAYYAPHDNKVIWLVHQHRQAYDLWETPFGDIHGWENGAYVRQTIAHNDQVLLGQARAIFTISQNVSSRLDQYNRLHSTPLYHPPASHERLHCAAYEPFIFYPSRIDSMKRQRLLVDAACHMKSGMQIVIAGRGSRSETTMLEEMIRSNGLAGRVSLAGYISEEQKIDYLARCTAVYFGAFDEDYGYVTLESMFSSKPVVTFQDSGGALEFVRDGYNGYVVEPDARALAERLDQLGSDPQLARGLGLNGRDTVREKQVSWEHVIDTLLEAGHV